MGAEAQSAAVIPFPTSESQPHAGLVAFLFTDIEGSSLKWLNHRTAMQEALPAAIGRGSTGSQSAWPCTSEPPRSAMATISALR